MCSLWYLIKKSGSVRMKRLNQTVWIQACHFQSVPSVTTSKPTLMIGYSTFSFQHWSSKCSGCTEKKSDLLHYLTLDRHLNVNQVLQSAPLTYPLVLKLKYCPHVSVGQGREARHIQSGFSSPFLCCSLERSTPFLASLVVKDPLISEGFACSRVSPFLR